MYSLETKKHISVNIDQEDKIGQSIWDKVICYWEIDKHVGNFIGTHWEHKNPTPQKKLK
jgi:hypothetical protein